MSLDNEDSENICFNFNWQYCSRHPNSNIDDIINNSSSSISEENHQWLSVSLPHIINTNTQNNSNPYNWWYRKQFNCLLSDQQSDQQVYLVFKSLNDKHNSDTSNIRATIWINGVEIFSNSLLLKDKAIEFPHNLLQSNEIPVQNKCKNTLVVCCENTSLSLRARLIIQGKIVCASGKMKIDKKNIGDNNDLNDKKEDNILNYTVRVNDTDGQIRVAFKNREQRSKLSSSSSSPLQPKHPVKPVINKEQIEEDKKDLEDIQVPRLAIVILIVGTRGDVQPFIALGQSLLAAGHRVRLATHESFRSFVRGNGLEFYPLAGDPADLMSFMVKNAGIIPSVSSIVAGDVSKHRHILADILASTWLACTAIDDETHLPFTAQAIIANPPSFGHVHCAEKLQIPLHIMFTMPWSPTTAFPHPLCKIDKGPTEKMNLYSYHVVEILTWSGMHNIVNHFRKNILDLEPLNRREATNVLIDERVPHTYCWSTALAPKPSDWESHINVSGFFFLDLGTTYTNPPQDLLDFLGISNNHHDNQKFPPIYIGFGSITGHDSRHILEVVVDALTKTGYRALLSGLATDSDHLPDNILKIGNVPHDWLFQYVSAVCHHGGAGTTAAGLRAGKPTIIVPFFGDQFFWGSIIEKSGAGPRPIPGKSITAVELAEAFRFAHQPATQVAAENIRLAMAKENGCEAAVRAFHAHLPLARMRSDLDPTYAAFYRIDELNIKISRPVAPVLISAGLIDMKQLRSHHIREWNIKHDRHTRALTHTVSDCIKKRSSGHVGQNYTNLRRTASSSTDNLSMNKHDQIENTDKDFHQDINYEKIDPLSTYGKKINACDRFQSLYDPYSEPNTHYQSYATATNSSTKTTKRALWHNQKVGLVAFLKRPHLNHQHRHTTSSTAEALIATANCVMEPAVGVFPSTTWLGQPLVETVKQAMLTYTADEMHYKSQTSPLTTTNEHQEKDDDQISSAAKIAAIISGLSAETCQKILIEYDRIKNEPKQTTICSSPSKKTSKHKFQFRRQRSHSTSGIN